ncbi:MAG: hypothetical protein WC553_00870 [Patescibacteria group bacterium]|jgi:hypothetical protein
MFMVGRHIASTAEEFDAKATLLSPSYYAEVARIDYGLSIGDEEYSGLNLNDSEPATEEQKHRLTELYDQVQNAQLTEEDFKGVGVKCAAELILDMEKKLAYRQAHGGQ